jgi:legumain
MFIDNGVDPDNIITMMYDDVANNTRNPYPGKLFNHPNGTDVYEGEGFFFRIYKSPQKKVYELTTGERMSAQQISLQFYLAMKQRPMENPC